MLLSGVNQDQERNPNLVKHVDEVDCVNGFDPGQLAFKASWSSLVQNRRPLNRMMSRRAAVVGAVASIFATGASTIPAMCQGRIYPGIQFRNADLASSTPEEAKGYFRSQLTTFERQALTVTFEDKIWNASLAELGMSIDYQTMVELAMAHGRTNGVLDRYETFLSRDTSIQIPLVLQENHELLDAFLQEITDDIAIAPTNARLALHDGQITVHPHAEGRSANIELARQEALQKIRQGEPASIAIATRPVPPSVTSDDLAGAEADAWNLVSEPIVFTHADLTYPVAPEDLTLALQIDKDNKASLDPTRLRDRFLQIARIVQQPARNAMIGWDNGPVLIAADVDGFEVDLERMEDMAVELAGSAERAAELPVKPVRAAVREDNFHELGIEAHLGSGSSSFAGSSVARAENVRVSASNISYKLVAPGEMFSFNELIGPISEDNGYVAGTIIQGDWVATDIGGGVCQVSTTVFRAAAQAGFRFSEWNPHSWRLAFYEADGSGPGFDAAIYQAESEWETNLDLQFENVLGSWLLLVVATDGDTVSARFYGKAPEWNVEIHPANVSPPVPPGPPVERLNNELAPGERRMVQQAQPGYQVSIRRVITGTDGEVLADGEFVSHYVPQPEAWEIGPT